MWTADMSRCPACPDKEICSDRLKIIQALQAMTNALNTDPAHVDGPGDGIIIVACHQHRVNG